MKLKIESAHTWIFLNVRINSAVLQIHWGCFSDDGMNANGTAKLVSIFNCWTARINISGKWKSINYRLFSKVMPLSLLNVWFSSGDVVVWVSSKFFDTAISDSKKVIDTIREGLAYWSKWFCPFDWLWSVWRGSTTFCRACLIKGVLEVRNDLGN